MISGNQFGEILRILNCISFETYLEITGFSEIGDYAQGKWINFQKDMAISLMNYDDSILQSFMTYCESKLNQNK